MNDEHSVVGLTDPRIIQILNQSKEGRAKLQGWKERESTQADDTQALPGFSLKKLAGMLLFSAIVSALMTFLMIGIIEVIRWIL